MQHHDLKTDPEVFCHSLSGKKGFEIRWNDRDFKEGDTVRLIETKYSGKEMNRIKNPQPLKCTGREINRRISYVLHSNNYGLKDGWVIFGFTIK